MKKVFFQTNPGWLGTAFDWLVLPRDPQLLQDLRIMRRRLLMSAVKELQTTARMAVDALSADRELLTKVDPKFPIHLIWAVGFFGEIGNYVQFAEDARKHGIQVICPYGGRRNTLPWDVSCAQLVETYNRTADITGRAPCVGGHSKGGQDARRAARHMPGLKRLILTASPSQGPSQRAFRWLMETLHRRTNLGVDVDHEEFAAVVRSGVEAVTLASPEDWVVQPDEAHIAIPGVRNIVLPTLRELAYAKGAAKKRRLNENHAGLFLRAEQVLFRELTH